MLCYHLIDTMACKVLIIDTFCEILENMDCYLHMEYPLFLINAILWSFGGLGLELWCKVLIIDTFCEILEDSITIYIRDCCLQIEYLPPPFYFTICNYLVVLIT